MLTTASGGDSNAHTISMEVGQYKDNIGNASLTVACNNNQGFGIYAIGYSGDTLGETRMLTTTQGATSIPTGTATSGNTSNWAMKLTAGSSTDTLNVISPFNDYASIPNTYTKVAEISTVSGDTVSATIVPSYAIYASTSQSVGTYTGKVKYTVVHPPNSKPEGAQPTTNGKIGYYPNAGGVSDTMGDQDATADTATTLWASNFKRAGYGFVGWSDKHDWVINQNDANGNGTGANAGYHIYGPNQTITTPSNLGTNGLSLYAVWVKSAGNLQNWNGCSSLQIGQVTALTDTRDNDTYAVAKLADGNCWMIENLRLGGAQQINLTTTDTNITTDVTLPASANFASGYTTIQINATNTLNPVSNMSTPTNAQIYSYGNYYSWAAAIGSATALNSGSATTSICPKGWKLPLGNNTTVSGSFSALDRALGGTGNNQSSTAGTTQSAKWRSFPNNHLYAGYLSDSSFIYRGSYGFVWSSTTYSSTYAYFLRLDASYLIPGTANNHKYYGLSVRCLADS